MNEPTKLMCPYCGWSYDPSVNGEGYSTVPNHWFKGKDCPGQQQHPRNAESDRRPLWREEQTSTAIDVTMEGRDVLQAELDRAVFELKAHRMADIYLRNLFKTIAPQCDPFQNPDGLATQIDNYIAGLRECLKSLACYAATAKDENTKEWIQGITDKLNDAAKMLNEPTAFVWYSSYGGHAWIETKEIP